MNNILSQEAINKIMGRWTCPCEALFEFLADNFPYDLVRLIKSETLEPSDLTFAVEALGSINDSILVREILLPLIWHESAVVREGVVYGLSNHLNESIKHYLKIIMLNDSSKAVRIAMQDILENVC